MHRFMQAPKTEVKSVNDSMLQMYVAISNLMQREEGQDLVEYSLVFSVIAFGCVGSMASVASAIGNTFIMVGQTLTTSMS